MSKVEIELTTDCNLRCLNCNRSVRQAPSNEMMSISQIKRFIKESLELNWDWKNIDVMGGEPTLHPNFLEIIKLLKEYIGKKSDCNLVVTTNGCGIKVRNILSQLPEGVKVRSSGKTSIINNFFEYNNAPIDIKKDIDRDYSKGCQTTFECGLGLTRYGYYPCGAGASVDRVSGFDIGIKRLALVNKESLKQQLKTLCGYCGQFVRDYNNNKRVTEEKMSPYWVEAYKAYKQNKPKLTLY